MFKPAENLQAFLKMGVFGFAGSGKTFTAGLIACGLFEIMRKEGKPLKPVFMNDTETGSDFLIPLFKKHDIPFQVSKTRAYVELMEDMKAAEKDASIYIIDSQSHFWNDLQNSIMKATGKDYVSFYDRQALNARWKFFTDWFVNSALHIIVCGRAGYEWDRETDEKGQTNLVKTGTKVKTQTEFGFEPNLIVEMVKVTVPNPEDRVEGQTWTHRAYVLKDRSTLLDSKYFDNPSFETFAPHFTYLNIGGKHFGVDATTDSTALFDRDGNDNWQQIKKQKEILLEEIEGDLVAAFPGQSAKEKKCKADIIFEVFKTRSWLRVGEFHLDELRILSEKVRQEIKKYENQPIPIEKGMKNVATNEI